MHDFTRRNFLYAAGASGVLGAGPRILRGQQAYPPAAPGEPIYPYSERATVALVKGEDRRKNVFEALTAIDHQIRPVLATKRHVIIKPNILNPGVSLSMTQPDALRGILEYLAPRFKGPVIIAESSSRQTLEGYENLKYQQVVNDFKPLNVSLLDLNEDGKYQIFSIIDANIRPVRVRLAARLLDSEAYIICSAAMKTHNAVVATLSVKNMVIGTPLHSARNVAPAWHDKRKYHAGPHQMNYNMAISAQKERPFWGTAVIDGFEGMEGDGPSDGRPVPSRIALASTDFLAADRVALETMGIPPHLVGYLQYAAQFGLGQYDLAKIDVLGEKPEAVKRTYKLHSEVQQHLKWLSSLPKA
jgi:uncharacterized protein (DUF362 family)